MSWKPMGEERGAPAALALERRLEAYLLSRASKVMRERASSQSRLLKAWFG
jgi:hypothetical protein